MSWARGTSRCRDVWSTNGGAGWRARAPSAQPYRGTRSVRSSAAAPSAWCWPGVTASSGARWPSSSWRPGLVSTESVRSRFLVEAQVLASIRPPPHRAGLRLRRARRRLHPGDGAAGRRHRVAPVRQPGLRPADRLCHRHGGVLGPERGAPARGAAPGHEAREHSLRGRQRAEGHRLRHRPGPGRGRRAGHPGGRSSARRPTWHPSRPAAPTSGRPPTSTRSASCSTSCSRVAFPTPTRAGRWPPSCATSTRTPPRWPTSRPQCPPPRRGRHAGLARDPADRFDTAEAFGVAIGERRAPRGAPAGWTTSGWPCGSPGRFSASAQGGSGTGRRAPAEPTGRSSVRSIDLHVGGAAEPGSMLSDLMPLRQTPVDGARVSDPSQLGGRAGRGDRPGPRAAGRRLVHPGADPGRVGHGGRPRPRHRRPRPDRSQPPDPGRRRAASGRRRDPADGPAGAVPGRPVDRALDLGALRAGQRRVGHDAGRQRRPLHRRRPALGAR